VHGCGTTGDRLVFSVGVEGCPGDPSSLPLWVCVGGDKCEGHPDTHSAAWRTYKASNHLSMSTVPRWFHTVDDLAKRAADQYLKRADRVGMRMGAWTQSGYRVGMDGGKVAEMTFEGKSWSVWVDAAGKITARPGN
jgi:hypothetical protein